MRQAWRKVFCFFSIVSIILAHFAFIGSAYAATATDAYDQPSSIKIATASNHSFTLVTPSGVAEGETIVFTFPTAFDTSTIIEDDVDISDDTVDLTTAANCTGAEQASVVMAADIITITICPGDGGSIAAASSINVEIGANASSSGSGINKITNPSSAGTYYVDVAGSFLDSASIPIPIIADDDVGVSASVASSGGGGGPPPPPPVNTVTVVTPNGGEIWTASQVKTLEWSSVGPYIASVNLYYSVDNGSSYSLVVSGRSPSGTYDWTVPDSATTTALIRAEATDLADIVTTDNSNAVFTIIGTAVPQTVSVTAPNGGETYDAGTIKPITWTTGGDVTAVDIYYSVDNGLNYVSVASNQLNNGTYNWTVPNVGSTDALIRLDARDVTGVVAQDVSDGVFTIIATPVVNTIVLLQPNGGQLLDADTVYSLEWISSGDVDAVDLSYSVDGGANFISIANNQDATGVYSWTVPNVETATALIRIDAKVSDTIVVSDQSDAVFSIIASEEVFAVTITQPNGGERLKINSSNIISWSSRGIIDDVDLYYSLDNGANFLLIEKNVSNNGSYLWNAPSSVSSRVLVRVDARAGGIIRANDRSDAVFSLVSDSIVVEPEPEPDPVVDVPIVEEPVTGETKSVELSLIVGREIILSDSSSQFYVLPNTSGRVNIKTIGEVSDVSVTYKDSAQSILALGSGIYETSFDFGVSSSSLTLSVKFNDGGVITKTFMVHPAASGLVYEMIDENRVPIGGAILIVYDLSLGDGVQWSATRYAQENPRLTGTNGAFAWYVPNGTYKVTAGKSNYTDSEATVRVRNNILSPALLLDLKKEEIIVEPDVPVEITDIASAVSSVTTSVSNSVEAARKVVSDSIDFVRENPEAQAVANVARPIIVASAIGGTVVLASSFSLLPFLQYLFTAPLLFFARRRRQQFGIIYNAFTKIPVDLAIVRLYSEAGKLVKTMVTDQEGRYFFQTDPGHYKIEVIKQGFLFPSVALKGKKDDGAYLDVYTGGLIEVTDDTAIISANIPVEPTQAPGKVTPGKVRFHRFLRIVQRLIGISGLVLSVFVWIIQPSTLSLGIMIFQIILLFVTLYLIRPKRKKGWGIVYEKTSGHSLRNTIVRLYEPLYNKLIETTITDGKGRYAFLAGPNSYYVTYEKPGFAKHTVSPVDYTKNINPQFITVDVAMQKVR